MSRGRTAAALLLGVLSSSCAYTWGVEHVPLIDGPGPHSRWLHVAGGDEVYDVDVHLPPTTVSHPAPGRPFVIVLHGYSGTGPGMERRTGLSRLADSAGFVVAYPNGQKNSQGRRSWTGSDGTSADVRMLAALVDSVDRIVHVDRRRLYLAGFSNGGMMTYRTALATGRTFAAIGVVAGALFTTKGDAAAPPAIPLVAVHGMRDHNVPFDGEPGGRRGAPGSVRLWAARNGCTLTPATDTLLGGLAVRTTYAGCRDGAAVVLYAMRDGGHGWPTAGTREAPLSTSDVLWRFFAEHEAGDPLVAPDRPQ